MLPDQKSQTGHNVFPVDCRYGPCQRYGNKLRHALIGGLMATSLWEIIRRILLLVASRSISEYWRLEQEAY
jgi:hypothetical protein